MKKNLFLTFCFSFIPGAGQMYQKYMKRGVSMMTLAASMVVIAAIFDTALFLIPLLIIEAYSFFDTYNIRSMTDEERAKCKDSYIWSNDAVASFIPDSLVIKKNKYLGILLIVCGGYFILMNILGEFTYIEFIRELYHVIRRFVPTLLGSGAAIIIGAKMIKE